MGHLDVIVIGSGFGGAAIACRLAEAGARVTVLERGRRWSPADYPRAPGDPWLFHHRKPARHNGWLDIRLFRRIVVLQGAGVGGGSLCYANVVMPADSLCFDESWPAEITGETLAPYYAKANAMLAAQQVPGGQETHRFALARRAAEALGYESRFERVPLAVSFDPNFSYALPDPINARHAVPFTNSHGMPQRTCVHLGNCNIGCDVGAKNTLDLNYLAAAERRGAEIRPLHLVRAIEPRGTKYQVRWDRIVNGALVAGVTTADRVVVSAGSLGSTELLLRCRDELKTLPNVSRQLGLRWSANANFTTTAIYPEHVTVNQGIGPHISSGLSFMDGLFDGGRFYVEDDGFPNFWLNALSARLGGGVVGRWLSNFLRRGMDESNPTARVMMWLGEGIDAGDGELGLGRSVWSPWRNDLRLRWDFQKSQRLIDAIIAVHERLSKVEGGAAKSSPLWQWLKIALTVHPLGGCALGASPETGVVDHRGEVFGYPNLFVVDGANFPRPIGRNPALTITALAERSADLMVSEGKA